MVQEMGSNGHKVFKGTPTVGGSEGLRRITRREKGGGGGAG